MVGVWIRTQTKANLRRQAAKSRLRSRRDLGVVLGDDVVGGRLALALKDGVVALNRPALLLHLTAQRLRTPARSCTQRQRRSAAPP